ncbi:hypothetical protein BDV10DRAFT_179901 [Aspergillus recurvatus]
MKRIIDMTEKDACLENGINLRYFHSSTDCSIIDFKTTDEPQRSALTMCLSPGNLCNNLCVDLAAKKIGPPQT